MQHIVWTNLAYRTTIGVVGCIRQWRLLVGSFHMYEANDIWTQHGKNPRVNTCLRMIWLRRVGMFLDCKFAYSMDSDCTDCLMFFHL
jgi:hypothetical protein